MELTMLNSRIYGAALIWLLAFVITTGYSRQLHEDDQLREQTAGEIKLEMDRKLSSWYPLVIDSEYGGYLSSFSHDWQPAGTQEKMIVTQARHLWTLSKVAVMYPDSSYAEFAARGFHFMRDRMWDDEFGGFYQIVSREGEPVPNSEGEIDKTLYGNAFALYGLAAWYKLSDDPGVLELAVKLFDWLDSHSYDPVYGGYYQPLARDGTPDRSGYPKDYNSGIHILEALTEFYMAWPDPLVRDRLEEMFTIVRDTMVSKQGYLKLYFQDDWTHLSFRDSTKSVIMENINYDHVTPGHDIETSFLLLEAAHALGLKEDEKTQHIAKKLSDHTLQTGWDQDTGGFYDTGYYFSDDDHLTILRDTKNWWAQAEGLNTLLIMADMYPDDPMNYYDKFNRQWEYIKAWLIDHEHGGWFDSGLDKSPESRTARKSHIWKGNYHTIRALMGSLELLQ